ncbi:DNA polymerase III subunit gamma and tau [Actinocorallia sp. API 0066]|uniref:DNA polymerase III subunit gamma and tau n=1 Tax=Actinocorallia sp. API 0066 TaxID=2896846 RepID=UPI001E286843|nr:DNA polymerase III subunit gamma and tau [Actinocorallia sp. API 0066]MCD0450690.1 DNA polymerase III subunit gamma and tau [Actinocorallia sp. API 0066]
MSLALYRKYRPATFGELKGQEHVAEPLQQALRNGRVNHAYLFSGPRGCGKTSSARILARSLNCEQGPTPDPCGVCESCVALGPGGAGHLDVIEIDAASHGGVDDARDLRERAFFSPVSARFKVYIIDEAHMVTREGFNALLKLVEEPPPHLKFVFATTEPEKVIGTIRSRTHHYPFRLIPPKTLQELLEEILGSENVPYEEAALPLVVRAGAGSARDSLSILDQLLAGSDEAGITYTRAVSLLGYTDAALLDEVVDAFGQRDGAAVFAAIDRVIESGQDPRRFTADLLGRFRDLVIMANVPEAVNTGLIDGPADELDRMKAQAAAMGPADLTRAADLLHTGLTEMRGATSPRLLLELICARILLPGAYGNESALLARLDRLERSGPPAPAGGYTRDASPPPARGPASDARAYADRDARPASASSDARAYAASASSAPPARGDADRDAFSAAAPGSWGGTPGSTDGAAPGSTSGGGSAGSAGGPVPGSTPGGRPTGAASSAPAGSPEGLAPGSTQWDRSAGSTSGGGSAGSGSGSTAGGGSGGSVPSSGASQASPAPSSGTGERVPDWAPEPSSAAPRPTGRPADDGWGAPAPRRSAPTGGVDVQVVRQRWPQILEAVQRRSRVAWMSIMEGVAPASVEGTVLTIAFDHEGKRKNFVNGRRDGVLAEVLKEQLGVDWRIEAVLGGSAPAAPPRPPAPAAWDQPRPPAPERPRPPAAPEPQPRPAPPSAAPAPAPSAPSAAPPPAAPEAADPLPPPPDGPDDLDESDTVGRADFGLALIQRELGGQIIGEAPNA